MGKTTQKLKLVSAVTVSAMLGMGAQIAMAQDDVPTMPGMNSDSISTMDNDSMQGKKTMPGMQSNTMPNMDSGSTQGQGTMPGMQGNSMQNMGSGGMQDQKTMPGMQSNTMPNMDSGSTQGQGTMPGMQGNSMQNMGSGGMQDQKTMPGMQSNTTSNMNSSSMQGQGAMSGMNMQGNATAMSGNGMSGDMAGMDANSMSAASQASGTRDPHAYSDGYTLDSGAYALPGPRQMRLADEHSFASLLVDRLETVHTSDNIATAYDMKAWFGRDYDRAMIRAEGDYTDSTLEDAKTELFWSHAVSSFWDALVGVRYDSGDGPDRKWLALGVQGLAPYWFELDATAYAGEEGRSALTLNAEYDMLFTQRLILQPALEANFYGKDDAERGIGTGLSDVAVGLRLRYEIRREIAPYIGVEWAGLYGGTADYASAAGADTEETRAVAGLRFWF